MDLEFSSTTFHSCLRDHTVFRDYFNKFCCLPVFGQRITFMPRRLKFVFDPPPLRNMQSYYKVPNSFVRDWMIMERLPMFAKSRVVGEFHLVQALQEIKYNKEAMARKIISHVPYSTVDKMFCILDDLKTRHLVRVHHMHQFMNLVRTSAADANIISFWIETDRLRHCEVNKRAGKLRKLQEKYFMTKSSHCLPYYILAKVYPERNHFDQYAFDLNRIIRLQAVILVRLHSYWLPRYLVSRRNVSRGQKIFLRKMELLVSANLEEEMMQSAFDQCPYVRKIPDPEASIKVAAKKAQNNKEFIVVADDDEENILVTEEQKAEIWDDEATEEQNKLEGGTEADLLGSEDVAFIHDHIFGSDHEMEKEKKSKKGKSKKKKLSKKDPEDEYVLFPGKTITVKRNDSTTSQSIQSSKPGQSKMSSSRKKKNSWKKALGQIREAKSTKNQEQEKLSLEERSKIEMTEPQSINSKKSPGFQLPEVKLPPIKKNQPFDPTVPRKTKSDTSHMAVKRPLARKSSSAILEIRKNKEERKLSWIDTKICSKILSQPNRRSLVSDSSSSESSSSSSEEEESIGSWESSFTDRTPLQTTESPQSTSISSNLTTETLSTWRQRLEQRDAREEYLRSVEPDMKLRDILASDKIAGYPFRDFLTRNCELVSFEVHGKARRECKNHSKVPLTKVYDIWRELETIRTTYFSLRSHELHEKYNAFLASFASQKSSPFYKDTRVKISNDQPFPNQLEILQAKLENTLPAAYQPTQDLKERWLNSIENTVDAKHEDLFSCLLVHFITQPPANRLHIPYNISVFGLLEPHWTKFAIEEQTTFRYIVVTTDRFTFKPRYSFPNSLAEIRASPILQKPLLTHPPQYVYDEFEALVKSGNLGSLGSEGMGHMRYRVSRSYRLFMNSMGLDLDKDTKFEEFVGDESSDEEGGIPPVKPKTYVRLPAVDPKEVAKRSAVEYPRRGIDYKQCVILRMRTQQRLEGQPLYMRPVKKHGVVLVRPQKKPKCLDDVLRDPLHYEFFKRYMKMHNSEAPLLFWKSVELLKRTENPMARQKKAQQILKKFFSRVAGGGIMLQCDTEIIKEVAAVDTVTTSMLVQTSIDVFKSMEHNWAERYFHTFPEDSVEEEEPVPIKRFNIDAIKTSRVWALFSEFMRKVARFVKSMRDPKLYEEFSNYLKKVPERPHSTLAAGGDASSTAILFQKYETVMYKHMNTDLEIRHRTKTINGRTVTLNFLINDLALWMENDRYVALCDNAKTLKAFGCFSPGDKHIIKEKKDTIVKCYLDSYVPPKIRVNMKSELAEQIIHEATSFGIINRSVFHSAMIEVFPNLMHYWQKFCHEKYVYISKQTTKRNRHAMVEERRLQIEKRTKQKREKLAKRIPLSQVSNESVASWKTRYSQRFFPDYVNNLKLRPSDKVKGLLSSDPPTLHFSIEHGLKLILPPRRRIVERLNNDELETFSEEDHFLKVWTRGAKVVNVFRQGSDPRLVNLGDEKRRFKVKCDMIEG